MQRRFFAAFAFLVLAAPLARAGVIVVAANGAGNFADLAPAIAAAADGDVLLVKSGNYTSFQISNKALDLVADVSCYGLGMRLTPRQHPPAPVMRLGTVAGNGEMHAAFSVGELGAGVQARRLFLQTVHQGADTYVGPVATVVLLDAAF